MNAPRLALLFVVLAAALYLTITRPNTQALGLTGDEYARLRRERAESQATLELSERRERAQQNALALLAGQATPGKRPLTAIRRQVLARLAGLPVFDVRLEVAAPRGAALAEVRVEARGTFLDLVALSKRLADPGAGLAVQRVTFTRPPREDRLVLAVEAQAVGARP
jgi:hypothetical protein